jgi:hypothetical protein
MACVFCGFVGEGRMKHYRVNKLAKRDGAIIKTKDVLAANDKQAVEDVRNDPDCPICDVWHAGEKIGSIT